MFTGVCRWHTYFPVPPDYQFQTDKVHSRNNNLPSTTFAENVEDSWFMSALILTSYSGSWFFHPRAGRGLSLSPSWHLLLSPQWGRLLSAIFLVSCAILMQTQISKASHTVLSLVLKHEHRASFQVVCLEIEEAKIPVFPFYFCTTLFKLCISICNSASSGPIALLWT